MADGHCFISYSTADAQEFATKLADELEGGYPYINVWFDKRDLRPGMEWDIQIDDGLKGCKLLLFVMTKDSTNEKSVCKQEWSRAQSYKKTVIPLLLHKNIQTPFRLGDRQRIDFTGEFEAGIAQLRRHIAWMASPVGELQALKDRLADAERDIQRASDVDKPRIQADIDELIKQIETQKKIVDDPEAAKTQTQKNIEAGLERERKPEKPTAAQTSTKFINPPPGIAPNWFQDRMVETKQIVDFLNDDAQRLMTIVGRGGVGKTAMVCRLLKGLEGGELPDGLGEMRAEGIVYLSESGSHRVNFANLFYDLCKLLPGDAAQELDAVYKNPQGSTESKMRFLLEKFTGGRVVLLLDNFEPLVDTETFAIRDAELDEALRAFLNGTHTVVNIVLTTRVAPRALNLIQPGRQRVLTLDEGLESPYAENILREMDSDGRLGLKSAGAETLDRARIKTRGFPRALEALFAILASDRYTTLEELLAMPLPENVVEALVGEAFNRLDTNAQKVMQALAVYNRPVTPAAVDYLLAPHLPAMDSAPILQRLVSMHFVRRYVGGKFHLHPTDREFSFDLIPLGSQTDWLTTGNHSQISLGKYFEKKFMEFNPDLIEKSKQGDQKAIMDGFAEFIKSLEPSDRELFDEMQKGIAALNPDIIEKGKNLATAQDKEFLREFQDSLKQIKVSAKWSQYALLFRAADYFRQARKPRAEWKKLDDLSAQLAEFDLRCAAGDYDTAASVVLEIDLDYLHLWGHYRLMIDLHEKLQEKINDKDLARLSIGNSGAALDFIGQTNQAIVNFEKALLMARESKNRQAEGAWLGNLAITHYRTGNLKKAIEIFEQILVTHQKAGDKISEEKDYGNLGSVYKSLGETQKALDYQKQALAIAKEIGDKKGEGVHTGNIGNRYFELGENYLALESYQQAADISSQVGDRSSQSAHLENIGHILVELEKLSAAQQKFQEAIGISDDISFTQIQNGARLGLAQAYLLQNDLVNARATIETALGYDVPENNHNASALHGIIALRQEDEVAARVAFVRAIGQADEILSKAAEYYDALDAKGLSICGLTICDLRLGRGAVPAPNANPASNTGRGDPAPTVNDAIKTFRKARKMAPHAGVVKSVLRLFDELAKCDTEGILKEVRKAVEGV